MLKVSQECEKQSLLEESVKALDPTGTQVGQGKRLCSLSVLAVLRSALRFLPYIMEDSIEVRMQRPGTRSQDDRADTGFCRLHTTSAG